jgi:hypothetical protein
MSPTSNASASLEIWKSIPEHPGYEVSNMGRVRSFWVREWRIIPDIEPMILRGSVHKSHSIYYKRVSLRKRSKRFVHLLVLSAFRGPKPIGKEGSHVNCDSLDNALENLVYATPVENNQHSVALGRRIR